MDETLSRNYLVSLLVQRVVIVNYYYSIFTKILGDITPAMQHYKTPERIHSNSSQYQHSDDDAHVTNDHSYRSHGLYQFQKSQ